MPTLYSYLYSSEGYGPWWGVRINRDAYTDQIRNLDGATRCFVTLTNESGDSLVVAVEGPHREDMGDAVFAPDWVMRRLGLDFGGEVMMDPVLEALPAGASVKVKPLTGRTVEGPMFVEGLTEALNQLGVVQEGRLTAVVDPSTGEEHEFEITDLQPAMVCLADGELSVDLERAADRPPTPPPSPPAVLQPEPEDIFQKMLAPGPVLDKFGKPTFLPFGGQGYRLTGHADAQTHPRPRLDRGSPHPLERILRGEAPITQNSG